MFERRTARCTDFVLCPLISIFFFKGTLFFQKTLFFFLYFFFSSLYFRFRFRSIHDREAHLKFRPTFFQLENVFFLLLYIQRLGRRGTIISPSSLPGRKKITWEEEPVPFPIHPSHTPISYLVLGHSLLRNKSSATQKILIQISNIKQENFDTGKSSSIIFKNNIRYFLCLIFMNVLNWLYWINVLIMLYCMVRKIYATISFRLSFLERA